MIKILAGTVTNAPTDILAAHLQTLLWQKLPKGVSVDLLYVADSLSPESLTLLQDAGAHVLQASTKPQEATYKVDDETHHWSVPTFAWLAQEKQRILDLAQANDYDAVFLVDSDLLLSPDTLASLLSAEKPIVSGVFWTKWQPDSPPLPQVWQSHPYGFQGNGHEAHEHLQQLAQRRLLRVSGLGACTLIRSSVLSKVGFWPLVPGLPQHGMWQGEDRHFCVKAQQHHVKLWADSWPDIFHVYRPSDLHSIPRYLEETRACEAISKPEIGSLISAILEPLEEPELAGYKEHVRGRLGALDLLPDIEASLLGMTVGSERVLKVRFPLWWKIPQYAGRDKILRIKLLGAKPFAYAPTLAEATTALPLPLVFDGPHVPAAVLPQE